MIPKTHKRLVYLASPFEQGVALRKIRCPQLVALGLKIQSSWIAFTTQRPGKDSPEWEKHCAKWSRIDTSDLAESNTLILDLTGPASQTGGCYVELGYAIAAGYDVFIVGPRTNAFCYHPVVRHFENWDKLLAYFLREQKT